LYSYHDHLDVHLVYLIYYHPDVHLAYLIYDHLDATSSAYHHPAFHFADVPHLAYYSADGHSLDRDHKQRRRWRWWRRRRWRRIDYYGICNC